MKLKFDKLYKKTNSGKIMSWEVQIEGDEDLIIRTTTTGEVRRKKRISQKVYWPSTKKNAIDRASFILENEFQKKLRLGYHRSFHKTVKSSILRTAMLAKSQELKNIKKMFEKNHEGFYLYGQIKVNGLRGTYHHTSNKIMSRELIHFNRLGWLANDLGDLLKKVNKKYTLNIEYIDFELFSFGADNVGDVVSMVRHGDKRISAYVFDVPIDNTPFKRRLDILKKLHSQNDSESIKVLPTLDFYNYNDVETYFKSVISAKAEGIILRNPESDYKWNNKSTRDTSLIKIKPILDDEFDIIGAVAENRIVDGIPQKLVIFLCCTTDGQEFVWTPTTQGVKLRIRMFEDYVKNAKKFIGRRASLYFREYTKTGKPFHVITGYIRDIM